MRKILNSTYGALLSPHFRFGRKEMGASVTGSGRQITTFMIEQIGELVTGNKTTVRKQMITEKDGKVSNIYHTDNDVVLLSDTDSVDKDSTIKTNLGDMSIEKLFSKGKRFEKLKDGREFSHVENITSWTSDGKTAVEKSIKMIYRHKVKKPRWKITLANGEYVIVTNDHSIMVLRNESLIEIKPSDINTDTDTCVSISKENG